MNSILINLGDRYLSQERKIAKLVRQILRKAGIEGAQISISLVDAQEIRVLNRKYRGIDRPTSVLSFFQGQVLPNGGLLLGEVIVCPQVGEEQNFNIRELIVHGVKSLLSEISTPKDQST